jgi:glycogen synthase
MIESILLRYLFYLYHSSRHATISLPLTDSIFQGGVVFSNIVTTVSPTYAQEVRTAEV